MDDNLFLITLVIYIFINVFTFILMGLDKRKARKNKWRTRERTIWLLSVIGGSVGTLFAMKLFRHKTKHRSFAVGIPLLIITQLCFIIIYGWLS